MASQRSWIIGLSTAGVLFAGYLASRWTFGVCTGGCSLLWGLPTCIYGFAIFATILVGAVLSGRRPKAACVVRGASVVGIIFSLWFAAQELMPPNDPFGYWLGLPNCVYGLLVYVAIAIIAFSTLKTSKKGTTTAKVRRKTKRK